MQAEKTGTIIDSENISMETKLWEICDYADKMCDQNMKASSLVEAIITILAYSEISEELLCLSIMAKEQIKEMSKAIEGIETCEVEISRMLKHT